MKEDTKLKKVTLWLILAFFMIASLGLFACNGNQGDGSPNNGGMPSPSPGGNNAGVVWGDIPAYSGAQQVQKGNWSIPPAQGEWTQVEWRYFETGDDVTDVADFYRSAMPDNGWEEMAWTEVQNLYWGFYTKNNEEDGAMFWASSEEGSTFFALMRARQ
jgi:hypothetical protein